MTGRRFHQGEKEGAEEEKTSLGKENISVERPSRKEKSERGRHVSGQNESKSGNNFLKKRESGGGGIEKSP